MISCWKAYCEISESFLQVKAQRFLPKNRERGGLSNKPSKMPVDWLRQHNKQIVSRVSLPTFKRVQLVNNLEEFQ